MEKAYRFSIEEFNAMYDIMNARYEEIPGWEFYPLIFPNNELQGDLLTDFSKPNAIYLYTDEGEQNSNPRLRRRIMLADTWEQDYIDYIEKNPKTLCGGLAYRGRANTLDNAQKMHAIIIDLDGVGVSELERFLEQSEFDEEWNPERKRFAKPRPTYIALSGTGLHLYYVFEKPIDLFPYVKVQMKSLKYDLTWKVWDYSKKGEGTSKDKNRQYQSINQGFRMVGSTNDKYGVEICAFETGDRVTVEYLNRFVRVENKVDLEKRFKIAKISKEEAKELYPEWYERVIVKKQRTNGKWNISGKVHGTDPYALYYWWLRKAPEIEGGHRYFFMMCASIYAYKCDVSKKQLRQDLKEAFTTLSSIKHSNPLTESDLKSAIEAYSKEMAHFPISDIEKLSGVLIEKNKRNGRKQIVHLKGARAIQQINDEANGTNWRRGNGRKSKGSIVAEWREKNPNGKKSDCIRETGLSKPTVYKWWK